MASELPDEGWSEEKILELLNLNISGSATKENRVLCLDILRKRSDVQRTDKVMDVLLKLAEHHGRSTPESSMIVELVSRLANLEEIALKKVLNKMISMNDNLLYCFARIIRNLEDVKKKVCTPRLLQFLMSYDSFTNITEEMFQTLVTIDNEDINKELVKATLPYLKTAEIVKLVHAVGIISTLASEYISELEVVIERALSGWYDAHRGKILKNIVDYFRRIKDEKTIPHLLRIIQSDVNLNDIDLNSKALALVVDSHPKAINQLWEFLEKNNERYPSILMVFAEMKTGIDLKRLLSVDDIDLNKWRPKRALKNIMIKSGDRAKPSLFKMIKDNDEVRYTFALECLEEIGVSIEEYSEVFEKPPILQVYEFFHGQRKGMLLENLWKEQDKLGDKMKNAQMRKFEYFIHHFFSTLGFVTMFVDPSGRKGVDLVAFSPNRPYILIIGCTIGVIKTDLQRLDNTLNEMCEALEKLCERFRILPMLITSKKVTVTDEDLKYAGKSGIAILAYEETTKLLEMLRTNRTSEEIIEQIELSIPVPDSDNPYE